MLQLFNNYWNNNYKIYGLFTSSLCALNYYFNVIPRFFVLSTVSIYLSIDTINSFINKDYIYVLHHYAGLSLIYFSYSYNFYNSKYSSIFINMENSNIIYNLILFTSGKLKVTLFVLFYFLFFYFRIFNFYCHLFQKEYLEFYLNIYNLNKVSSVIFFYIPLFIIANLNLYWFYLMTKKFIKKIKKL